MIDVIAESVDVTETMEGIVFVREILFVMTVVPMNYSDSCSDSC